jgi:hypothetical protein
MISAWVLADEFPDILAGFAAARNADFPRERPRGAGEGRLTQIVAVLSATV